MATTPTIILKVGPDAAFVVWTTASSGHTSLHLARNISLNIQLLAGKYNLGRIPSYAETTSACSSPLVTPTRTMQVFPIAFC